MPPSTKNYWWSPRGNFFERGLVDNDVCLFWAWNLAHIFSNHQRTIANVVLVKNKHFWQNGFLVIHPLKQANDAFGLVKKSLFHFSTIFRLSHFCRYFLLMAVTTRVDAAINKKLLMKSSRKFFRKRVGWQWCVPFLSLKFGAHLLQPPLNNYQWKWSRQKTVKNVELLVSGLQHSQCNHTNPDNGHSVQCNCASNPSTTKSSSLINWIISTMSEHKESDSQFFCLHFHSLNSL